MRVFVDPCKAFYRFSIGAFLITLALGAHGDPDTGGNGISIAELREFASTQPQVEFRQ